VKNKKYHRNEITRFSRKLSKQHCFYPVYLTTVLKSNNYNVIYEGEGKIEFEPTDIIWKKIFNSYYLLLTLKPTVLTNIPK
jgi:hypothetical protein